MSPLEAAVMVALLALPFHLLVWYQISRLSDPAHIRSEGVVIVKAEVLQAHSESIGTYMGREIWASVVFMGMLYRFERIVPPRQRGRVGPRELQLEPGLLYLTD